MNLTALFPDLINITEAFNTNFTSILWNNTNTGLIGTAVLDGEEFELYLEPSAIMIGGVKRYWIHVAFARKVDGELKQDLFPTGSNQSRQLGAVINALNRKLRELVSQFKIDAVVFTIQKGQEKRIALYKRIMLSKIYGIKPWQYRFSIEWGEGTALVATKEDLDKQFLEALRLEITSLAK
jgi:hypothetical protein